jgi:FkbM family methyltransferase
LSTAAVLAQATAESAEVATVIDVGAAFGDWSVACSRCFPDARYVLVEPLEEYAPFLRRSTARLRDATEVRAAAAERSGTLKLNVHADLVGTSRFEEAGEELETMAREVRAVALDELAAELGLRPRYVLKVDVQGAELRVLEGARSIVADAALVVLEVSFFPIFVGGSTFEEVVAWVREAGLVVYDVTNLLYRPLDGALAQADLACVPAGSPLRRNLAFSTPEQRRANDTLFLAKLEVRRRRLRG